MNHRKRHDHIYKQSLAEIDSWIPEVTETVFDGTVHAYESDIQKDFKP